MDSDLAQVARDMDAGVELDDPRKQRPDPPKNQDFWVFGYGSLMWNPGFPHTDVKLARLYGYRRRFCVYSVRYRGTPERPGLVLGLDRGGSCWGLAFKVPAAEGEAAMDYLHWREMRTGSYLPRWLTVKSEDGPLEAIGYVVDRAHPQYAGHLDDAQTAELICQGEGARGACREYLENTVRHLEALGLHDSALHGLLARIEPS